jgi:hypothetical protein
VAGAAVFITAASFSFESSLASACLEVAVRTRTYHRLSVEGRFRATTELTFAGNVGDYSHSCCVCIFIRDGVPRRRRNGRNVRTGCETTATSPLPPVAVSVFQEAGKRDAQEQKVYRDTEGEGNFRSSPEEPPLWTSFPSS